MTLGNTWSVVIRSSNKKRRLHISISISLYSWKKAVPGHLSLGQCPCWQQGTWSTESTGETSAVLRQRWQVSENWSCKDDGFGDIWAGGKGGGGGASSACQAVPGSGASSPRTWRRCRTISTSHWWNSPIYLSIQRCGSEYEDTSSCLWDHNINISHTYGCGLKCGYG